MVGDTQPGLINDIDNKITLIYTDNHLTKKPPSVKPTPPALSVNIKEKSFVFNKFFAFLGKKQKATAESHFTFPSSA